MDESQGQDAVWMRRALRLAVRSVGQTAPNPGVGCILVRDGVELGAGRHRRCGEAHAEVAALADCRQRGHDPAGTCAYVTLAPCTRQGRTPPCVEALIAAGVKRVVAALPDPDQDQAGLLLAAAGVEYHEGLCADLAAHLHGGFLARVRQGRPRCTGKWAMTLDGFLACVGGHSSWLSDPEALALSRRRRRCFDAIVVGAGTARRDDPRLLAVQTARSPLRVVVSATASLPPDGCLARGARQQPVLVMHDARAAEAALDRLQDVGVRVVALRDAHDPRQVLAALHDRGCAEVLVEGGAELHGGFLRAGLYDRLELYLAARTLHGGLGVAAGPGVARVELGDCWDDECPPLRIRSTLLRRLRRRDGSPSQDAAAGAWS